ncbi:MAG: hypothetical protein AB8B93_15815 [Pseudomonadales bacterium]
MRPLPSAILVLTILMLGGCRAASPNTANYPEHYVSALSMQSGVDVQAAHLQPFTAFITRLGRPEWEQHFEGVYAERVHFSDTLAYINDRATLRAYFADLADNGATVQVNILSAQRNGADAYLIWEMTTSFTPVLSTKQSHSIGITHLRFNAAGEVILHQDFWDAATGFYQHVPVLGGALRGVRARLQPATP